MDLNVIPNGSATGTLEFSFVCSHNDEPQARYVWEVDPELMDVLHLEGELSEDVLRQQLARAMAEEQTVDALGSGSSPVEWMERSG